MQLDSEFLKHAIHYLEKHTEVAGVAGIVKEMNQSNYQFQQRVLQSQTSNKQINRLTQGGVYKNKAIEQVGYFTLACGSVQG